jgi:hypothetical protein
MDPQEPIIENFKTNPISFIIKESLFTTAAIGARTTEHEEFV